MLLLPVEMQDLPLSSRMYPLAQEHTTEFCSSLQNWSQSPLSRLQNFRMAVGDACWFSGQAGETEAAAGREEGQQPQGDIHPPVSPIAATWLEQKARATWPTHISWCKQGRLPGAAGGVRGPCLCVCSSHCPRCLGKPWHTVGRRAEYLPGPGTRLPGGP